MLSSENVRCWQLTGNNSNKGNKPNSTPSTSFQVQWQKVVSQKFKEQAEKNAKEFVSLSFPPGTFTDEQLDDLKFGKIGFYDMLTNMVVRTWIYQFKNGIPIDYKLLKRSAESPLAIQTLYLNFFGEVGIFSRIEDFHRKQKGLNLENRAGGQEERPDIFIEYINSDQFIEVDTHEFTSNYFQTLTFFLYGFYQGISEFISNGFLDVNKSWFDPPGSLNLSDTGVIRVNGTITKLQENPTYEHVTPEKALKHLDGQITLKQLFAPDPIKGGNCTRKRKCTHTRKLRKNKRKCTHKRLPTTAKSRIMRGK